MTREQLLEAEKILPLLNECRTHLDNAMYRMGVIDKESYAKLRKMYDGICQVLDMV